MKNHRDIIDENSGSNKQPRRSFQAANKKSAEFRFLNSINNCDLNGIIKAGNELFATSASQFETQRIEGLLLASERNLLEIMEFLLYGIQFIILDRDTNAQEKLKAKRGLCIYIMIDDSSIKNYSNINFYGNNNTVQFISQVKIGFRTAYGRYGEYIYADNPAPMQGYFNEFLSLVLNAYLEEKESADKEKRSIMPIRHHSRLSFKFLNSLMKSLHADLDGFSFAFFPLSSEDMRIKKAIVNAYINKKHDQVDILLHANRDFKLFCPSRIKNHIYYENVLQYVFLLSSQTGNLDLIQSILKNDNQYISPHIETLAFIHAVNFNRNDCVKKLSLTLESSPDAFEALIDAFYSSCPLMGDPDEFINTKLEILGHVKSKHNAVYKILLIPFLASFKVKPYQQTTTIEYLIEYMLKDPEINPDFHHLPTHVAGVRLALQSKDLNLLLKLSISYELFFEQKMGSFYKLFTKDDKSPLKLFIIASCILSEKITPYMMSLDKIYSEISKNCHDIKPFIDSCLKMISNTIPKNCNPAIKRFLSFPEIFFEYTQEEWIVTLKNHSLLDDKFELATWINLQSQPITYLFLKEIVSSFNNTNLILYFPSELLVYITVLMNHSTYREQEKRCIDFECRSKNMDHKLFSRSYMRDQDLKQDVIAKTRKEHNIIPKDKICFVVYPLSFFQNPSVKMAKAPEIEIEIDTLENPDFPSLDLGSYEDDSSEEFYSFK